MLGGSYDTIDDVLSASRKTRPISWIKAAKRDFEAFPKGARREILRALTIAAEGQRADIAKPLKGLGSGVWEVALRYRTDAYRAVYALQLGDDLWVIDAFQKKSTRGRKTPAREIELVREWLSRLRKELNL